MRRSFRTGLVLVGLAAVAWLGTHVADGRKTPADAGVATGTVAEANPDSGASEENSPPDPTTTSSSRSAVEGLANHPVQTPPADAAPVVAPPILTGSLHGWVLDPGGAPVFGAEVRVEVSLLGAPEQPGMALVTDAQGAFELTDLAAGTRTLRASAEGFAPSAPRVLELTAGESAAGIELRLRPASGIQGEFLDTTGRPQPERQVNLLGDRFRAVDKTDGDGRFEFGGVPPGEFFLYAAMENETEIQQRVLVAEGETVHVRLAPPPGLLRMHGTLQIGGARVYDAEVSARIAGEGGKGSATTVFTDTDADGAYQLELPGPGVYVLSIVASKGIDWLSWNECLDLPSVGDFPHDVAIPLGRISGRVTDATGRALAGVEIESAPEPGAAGPSGSADTETDDKGRYELNLPAGAHSIFASGLRMPEARVDGLEVAENAALEGIDFVIAAGGLVSGRVSNADGTVASYARIWSREGARLAMSDEDGRFELGLGAGLHNLAAHSRTGVTREFAEVDVSVGSTTSIDLVLVPARLVYLSIRQGRLPVAARVELRDSHGKPQPVEPWEAGEAWLGPLLPGRYTVSAERDGKRAERTFEVASRTEAMDLTLVFE